MITINYSIEAILRYSAQKNLGLDEMGAVLTIGEQFAIHRIVKAFLNLAEKVLRRRSTNMEEFDQLAFGKQASRYPYTARFARQLEAYAHW